MNERIHLVPPTGHKRFRTSLCGVQCAEGGFTSDEKTFARGTSTPAHADCEQCAKLAEKYETLDAIDDAAQAESDAIEDAERAEERWDAENNAGMP